MKLTRALTEFALMTKTDSVPESALAASRKLTLDSLACALAGWHAPGMAEVVDQMRNWGGAPEASLLIHGDHLPAPNAAFANSVMIHALDYDDVHIPGSLHIMSVVLPAALAAAEVAGATGRDVLAAVAVGVEVAARIAIRARDRDTRAHAGHLLPSSIIGGFGAVAASARLLDMPANECVDAMGINYAQTSGNRQALHDRTLTKRLQPAFAARSALWATALAGLGITGPSGALDGDGGLFRAYYEAEPPSVDELMVRRPLWEIERTSIKRYPSCGACHSAQGAAERLRVEEGLRPEDIERVEIFGHRLGGFVSKPFEMGDSPQVAAQFNVQWCVAYALLRGGARLADLTDEAVRSDTEVADLARAITFTETPEDALAIDELPPDVLAYAGRPHGVIVHTRDGRRLMRSRCPAETFAPDAVTEAEVLEKLRACAEFSGLCEEVHVQSLLETRETLMTDAPVAEAIEAWTGLTV